MKISLSFFQTLVVALALALPVSAQSFLTNGLVLYYPFNGNATDASGNGNNGIVQGATLTTNRFGVPNTAYAFNGQSGIQIPETIFGPAAPAVTISMWVTTYTQNYSFVTLLEKGPLNGEMNMGTTSSSQFQFGPILNTYGTEFVSTPLMSNTVVHLVGVYQKGQSIALYTNGVLAANMPIPDDTLKQTSQYPISSALGIYDYTPAPFGGFPGNIEDVRIYTNALTASQVQQLYQYESTPPSPPSFITNGLVMYYPFNGNANDASGNGNNGTVQGATLTTNRFGVPNSAYAFDGVQDLIQFPDSIFGASVPAFTISLWVTTDNGPYGSGQEEMFHKGSMNGEMAIDIGSGDFALGPFLTTNGWEGLTTPMISNAVTHLVGVYQQGQSISLYTNGVLAANMSLPNADLKVDSGYPLASALGIYDYTPGPYNAFHGHIENVRVYTNALTALQVQELYQYESIPPEQAPPGQPPIITSFAPAIAFVGTNVTITGLDFSPVTSSNIVYFGAVQADVIEASPTNLVVTVPVGATFAPITVTVNGLTGYSDQPFLPTFLGNGLVNSSTFGSPMILPTVSGPAQVVLSDLDGDGRPDLVIADSYAADIVIYQNLSSNGVISFGPQLVLPVVPAVAGNTLSIAVVDVDGDGKPDIIASTSNSNLIFVFRNISSPGLLTTNSFAPPVITPAGDNPQIIAVQDLNGDGKPDVVIPNAASDTISILQNQSTVGNIAFGTPVNFVAGNDPEGVAIADLDGDGYPDIAVANRADGTVSIFRNLGLGGTITSNSFTPAVTLTGTPQNLRLKIGDIDQDGRPDLVVGDWYNDEISVFRNLTTGPGITTNSFAAPVIFSTGGWANNLTLGDLSGDKKLDVVVVDQLPSLFSVFNNASTPGSITSSSLGPRADFTSGWNPNDAAIGDLNGDGRPDLVIANQYGPSVYVFVNNTPLPLPVITNEPQDDYVNAYGTASFTVGATGTSPLSYQWLFGSSDIGNATNDILTIPNIDPSALGQYFVVITNMYGAATSSPANLYMYPAIVDPFTGFVTESGQTNTLSVGAWGSGVLTYQWYDNGVAILNATNAALTFPDIQFTNAGSYSVVVSSSLGSVTNTPAQVVVNPPGFSIGLYPGIMVTGTVGNTYIIESSPDLSNSNGWTTLGTITLTAPVQLWVDTNIDASLPANPHHFYRLVPGP